MQGIGPKVRDRQSDMSKITAIVRRTTLDVNADTDRILSVDKRIPLSIHTKSVCSSPYNKKPPSTILE